MELTINIEQTDYEYLTQVEAQSGKSIQDLFLMWLSQLPLVEADYDVTQDPIYQIDGYNSDAPIVLSSTIDQVLYGEELS